METALIITSALCVALIIALIINIQRHSSTLSRAARLEERAKIIEIDNARLNDELNRSRAEIQRIKSEHDNDERKREERFELLARRVLDRRGEDLRSENIRQIEQVLTPLKEDITRFRSQVNECYASEARERFSLQERIKDLIEANKSIGREARELSSALRGNSKMQGDWGELILESILEKSGLRRNEEFFVQPTTDDAGNVVRNEQGHALRPDVVVRYPDRGVMVIDSKVSLTAFVEYVNSDDPATKDILARRHLDSVTKHIRELAEKNYQDYIGNQSKLDFVMMFIPNESAYATALSLDPELWQKAYDKRVVIASPTQLVGALRLVAQLWRHDRQTANAIEIARKSGQMYDKFAGFVDDMLRIERSLESTSATFSEAMKKLRDGKGNLISRAEKLRELGVKTAKQLPATNADDDSDAD